MKLNYQQLQSMLTALTDLKEQKMPFKLGIIIAKDIQKLKAEVDFFIEREREFAFKYLVFDEEKQEFVQVNPGAFKIKDGLEQECQEARLELDSFETEVDLLMLPSELLENTEFTPEQLLGLTEIISE